MRYTNLSFILAFGLACSDSKNDTADTDTGSTTGDSGAQQTDPVDTSSEDTGSEDTGSEDTSSEDTGSEDTGSEDTGSEDTGSDDTGSDDTGTDPLDNAVCDPGFAGCSDQDFAANDFTGSAAPVTINMVGMQPYSPKCLTVRVGQTVRIGAAGNHPFSIACAEDTIMDSQNGSTSQVEFTFETPGYYNYRCGVPSHVNMVGNIKVLP